MISVLSALAMLLTLSVDAVAQPAMAAADRALAREILRELVEIPTTEAEGTARAAQMLVARLNAAGFPKEDVQVLGPDARTQIWSRASAAAIPAPVRCC